MHFQSTIKLITFAKSINQTSISDNIRRNSLFAHLPLGRKCRINFTFLDKSIYDAIISNGSGNKTFRDKIVQHVLCFRHLARLTQTIYNGVHCVVWRRNICSHHLLKHDKGSL
ncbi:pentatricopeptide repeat-containing protein [Trifolium repens]|nr:pentatricopeptide repeat-containing protein [Trifolium repens]